MGGGGDAGSPKCAFGGGDGRSNEVENGDGDGRTDDGAIGNSIVTGENERSWRWISGSIGGIDGMRGFAAAMTGGGGWSVIESAESRWGMCWLCAAIMLGSAKGDSGKECSRGVGWTVSRAPSSKLIDGWSSSGWTGFCAWAGTSISCGCSNSSVTEVKGMGWGGVELRWREISAYWAAWKGVTLDLLMSTYWPSAAGSGAPRDATEVWRETAAEDATDW